MGKRDLEIDPLRSKRDLLSLAKLSVATVSKET
jgi:hypothetical protein